MRSLAIAMALSTASAFTSRCGRGVGRSVGVGLGAAARAAPPAVSMSAVPRVQGAVGPTLGHPDCPLLPPVTPAPDGTCNVATFAMA
mmetsp:Transcript_18005/g.47315  ORF Transcript_18005/g.47315 Transcript_18005/m.47315 type:complete len:87 (-) Transcript_18005:756-1016(-)